MMSQLKVYPHFLANCSPLVAGDFVYVVTGNGADDNGMLPSPQAPSFLAVEKQTGKVAWQSDAPGANIMDGQWSNPSFAVVNGQSQAIFPGGDGWLYGFDAKDGKPIWKFNCNPKDATFKPGGKGTKNYIMSTPVIVGNKAYVGVGQNPDHGPGVGHLWCVDITKTGDLSPVDNNFDPTAAVNKNSGLVWHYGGAITPKPKAGRDTVFGRTLSTCAIHDGLLFIAELDGYLHCVDAKTGQKCWEHDLKAEVWGSPYYADGKVYLGTGDGDLCVAPRREEATRQIEMERSIKFKRSPSAARFTCRPPTCTGAAVIKTLEKICEPICGPRDPNDMFDAIWVEAKYELDLSQLLIRDSIDALRVLLQRSSKRC